MGLSIPQMAVMSRLLDEALSLDPAARRRWLDSLPTQYSDLSDALREALTPVGEIDELARMLDTGARIRHERVANPNPGDTIGPYRLIRQLGKGGMAEVWLAQRSDGAFQREVALKLPTLSRMREDLESRFSRECDILAALEHPNIARLYDAGVGTDGLPYLAMEYVAGEPLLGWCDSRTLGVRERLELFLQVLDAVQYAHARHVIHRDIKPSNIMVTTSGHAQLLDFGVAKLLSKDALRTDLTQRYGRAMTPNYASPELVRGEDIAATTDVYALGVVLYELLSGNIPYYLEAGAPITELQKAIADAVVKRPSMQIAPGAGRVRNTTDQALARRLKGDLDAIVMKSLAKATVDRYDSAAALADDLRRSLTARPVMARANTLTYRGGKFVQRHRAAVFAIAATALVGASLVFGLTRSGREVPESALNAGGPSGIAPIAAPEGKSIAVLPFLDLSERKDQEYFSDGLSEQLIDHIVHTEDIKVIARTSSFQFKGTNEDVRSIARKLGVTHVLEGSVSKIGHQLRITAQLIRASDGVDLWSQSYDRNLVDIFKVQDEIGEKVSVALHTALHDRPAAVPEPNVEAFNLVLEGNYFKARYTAPDVQRAIDLYRKAIEIDPDYALAWARLGSAYLNQEVIEGAPSQAKSKRVLDTLDHAISLDPHAAWAYYSRGGFESSIAWDWDAAQADVERIRQADPRFDLLPGALGDVAMAFGQVDRAVQLYQEVVGRNPLDPNVLDSFASALCAANQLQKCLQTRMQLLQLHPEFGGALIGVGLAHLYLGQFDAALEAMHKEPNEDFRLTGLAVVYSAMGRRPESDAALEALIKKFGSNDPYGIAQVYGFRGQVDEAFQWLDRSYTTHNGQLLAVKADPLLRKLHGDSRFQTLLSKLKLTGKGQSEGIVARN